MGKRITQYQADDGAVFGTEVEMVAHEAGLDAVRIDQWIESVENWSRGESARAKRLVADFLAFERSGGVPRAALLDLTVGPAANGVAEVCQEGLTTESTPAEPEADGQD